MESDLEEIAKGARSCEEIQKTLNELKEALEANPRTRTVGDYLSGFAGEIKALNETFVRIGESWETIEGTQRTQISSLEAAEAKHSELLLAQSTQISDFQEQVAGLSAVDAKHSELLLAHAQLRTESDGKDNDLSEKQKEVDKLKVIQQELASKIEQQTTGYDNMQQQLQSSISKSTQFEKTVADLSRRLEEVNEKAERAERLAKEVETKRKQDELDPRSVQATYGVDTSSIKPWNQTLLAALYKNEAEHKEKIETELANMPQLMAAIHQEELDRRLPALMAEYKRKEAEVKE